MAYIFELDLANLVDLGQMRAGWEGARFDSPRQHKGRDDRQSWVPQAQEADQRLGCPGSDCRAIYEGMQ